MNESGAKVRKGFRYADTTIASVYDENENEKQVVSTTPMIKITVGMTSVLN
jgi:hypothetical protein